MMGQASEMYLYSRFSRSGLLKQAGHQCLHVVLIEPHLQLFAESLESPGSLGERGYINGGGGVGFW